MQTIKYHDVKATWAYKNDDDDLYTRHELAYDGLKACVKKFYGLEI